MKYREIIEKITKDILLDFASFRVQLVYMSYVFNLIVLYLVGFKSLDWKALTISFGTQTVIYAFYFASKQSEVTMKNNAVTPVNDEPPADDRDPDKVDPNA